MACYTTRRARRDLTAGDIASRQGRRANAGTARLRSDALEGARHGEGDRHLGGEDMARSWFGAASLAQLQANDRAFAEKLHGVVRLYVSPPAHAILLPVYGRVRSSSSTTRSRTTAQARPGRDHDTRLQAQRHDDAFHDVERTRWLGGRAQYAASPRAEVHPVPERR
jgi:hypothetical protein